MSDEWRGPTLAEWLARIAAPAMRVGETLPFIKPQTPFTSAVGPGILTLPGEEASAEGETADGSRPPREGPSE